MREAGVDTGLLENDAGKEAMGIKNWLINKLFASVFTSNVPAIQVMGQQLVELLLLRRWCLGSWKIWSWMSPWPHGRHPRVLKEVALEIVEALVVIFQQSLTGMVDQKLMWTSTSTVVTRAEYPAGSNLSPCTQVFPPSTKHKSWGDGIHSTWLGSSALTC